MEAGETADLLVAAEETFCLLVVRVEDSEKDIAFKSGMNRLFCTGDFLSRFCTGDFLSRSTGTFDSLLNASLKESLEA